jgi:hypothetical protein
MVGSRHDIMLGVGGEVPLLMLSYGCLSFLSKPPPKPQRLSHMPPASPAICPLHPCSRTTLSSYIQICAITSGIVSHPELTEPQPIPPELWGLCCHGDIRASQKGPQESSTVTRTLKTVMGGDGGGGGPNNVYTRE